MEKPRQNDAHGGGDDGLGAEVTAELVIEILREGHHRLTDRWRDHAAGLFDQAWVVQKMKTK